MANITDLKNPMLMSTVASKWPCQSWTFEVLSKTLGSRLFSCRVCEKSCGRKMETEYNYHMITMQQFDEWVKDISNDGPLSVYSREKYSCYIDYKYMKDMFSDVPDFFNKVRWKDLGLNDFDGYDSTIWLGSEGASTPGHQDTYGFNLVSQIYGRKLWILFPPEDSPYLYPTRIPYEESSIFTMVNLRKPDLNKHDNLKRSHPVVVVLYPGQTLYVPRHWWHYVESLEPSISINVWVPSNSDSQSHLSEAITRCLITSLISPLDLSENKLQKAEWLNPTELLDSMDVNLAYLKTSLNILSSKRETETITNIDYGLNNIGEVTKERSETNEPADIVTESSDEGIKISSKCLDDKPSVSISTLSGAEKDYLKLFFDKVKQMSFKQGPSSFQMFTASSSLGKRKLSPTRCVYSNKRRSPHSETHNDDVHKCGSHDQRLDSSWVEPQVSGESDVYTLIPCSFESYLAFLDNLCIQMKCSCLLRGDKPAEGATLTLSSVPRSPKHAAQQLESSPCHSGDQPSPSEDSETEVPQTKEHHALVNEDVPNTDPESCLHTKADLSSLSQLDIAENLLASVLHPDVIDQISQKFLDMCLLSQSAR